jgi:hypothetical protein
MPETVNGARTGQDRDKGNGHPAGYIVAAFAGLEEAHRASVLLRQAELVAARITIEVEPDYEASAAPPPARSDDRTTVGAIVGGLSGLFAGGLLVQLFGADTALETALTVSFSGAGGACIGGFVAAAFAGESAADSGPKPPPVRRAAVVVQSEQTADLLRAARLLRGRGPLQLSASDPSLLGAAGVTRRSRSGYPQAPRR